MAMRATVRKATTPVKKAGIAGTSRAAAASPSRGAARPAAAAAAKPAVSGAEMATPPVEAADLAAEIARSVPELPRRSETASDAPDLSLDESMVASLEALENGNVRPDEPEVFNGDWSSSFQGLGSAPFPREVSDVLLAPVVAGDVEITPDGLIYLPEIKYRRILNRAFGPGGWGIVPRTKTLVTQRKVTREYGLICLGRLVSVSRGEMDYFSAEGVTTAMEGCKSNALMRCCKDLGIASELWDPSFIREFKAKHCDTKYFEKKKRFAWKRKDRQWEYPYV